MTITLPDDLSEFVRRQVESGAYPNESELMADAVRRLMDRTLWQRLSIASLGVRPEPGADPVESELMADVVKMLQTHPKAPAHPDPSSEDEHRPIWEVVKEIADRLPANVVAPLPVDGAEQHGHYIDGTPKKPPA